MDEEGLTYYLLIAAKIRIDEDQHARCMATSHETGWLSQG